MSLAAVILSVLFPVFHEHLTDRILLQITSVRVLHAVVSSVKFEATLQKVDLKRAIRLL